MLLTRPRAPGLAFNPVPILLDPVIDGVLEHSPAEYVRRPNVPAASPTLGLSHLQFEALLTAAKQSTNSCDFALVTMLGLLGLRVFEATGSNIEDLGEEHGHRVLRVHGKGDKIVLVPLPPAVSRAIERSIDDRTAGPILLTCRGTRMDRRCATRRLRRLAEGRASTCRGCTRTCSDTPLSPRCSTPVWTCVTCRSPPGTPTRVPPCGTTVHATTSTDTPTSSSPPTWPPGREGHLPDVPM